ncbi:MAG: DNA-binding domain-containing protein [Pseudomonadota bacterium]
MTDQTHFHDALLDASQPVPDGLTDPEGRPAGKRFDVYRNNVAVSLTQALETGFPVIRKLVGDEFFKAMAGVYLRTHPPTSPVLQQYGEDMPSFLRGFKPAHSLPYLPDMARLEVALRRAYHAEDAPAFDPQSMAALKPEALNSVRFEFAPAAQVIRSHHPIHGIWLRNTTGGPVPSPAPENVLVTRPEFDPIVTRLDAAQAVFVIGLMENQTLTQAALRAQNVPGAFDLSHTLGLLFGAAALSSLKI